MGPATDHTRARASGGAMNPRSGAIAGGELNRSNQRRRVNGAGASTAMVRQADHGPKALAVVATARRRASVPDGHDTLTDLLRMTPMRVGAGRRLLFAGCRARDQNARTRPAVSTRAREPDDRSSQWPR